ncbi:MAG: hypothetical protein KZQ86_04615 [Candidatus Thiodiazotropha sp. (ex Lucinoma kastoroae)]|nr:hypothetical protein [Candidatus Thiodiazotropha sp. (ex Lucinoma kastoroae)]
MARMAHLTMLRRPTTTPTLQGTGLYYFYLISPWALLFASAKAWHQNFIWRRMLSNRQSSPVLSRGEHRAQKDILRPNILEHSSTALFLLAVVAILKQLSISHIGWWLVSIIGAIFTLRLIIKGIK